MKVAEIERDYLTNKGDPYYRVGKEFHILDQYAESINAGDAPKTRFRLKDDDEEVYYGGWLFNDADCEVQFEVLRWAMVDSGCTIIEIKNDNGNWRQEIG